MTEAILDFQGLEHKPEYKPRDFSPPGCLPEKRSPLLDVTSLACCFSNAHGFQLQLKYVPKTKVHLKGLTSVFRDQLLVLPVRYWQCLIYHQQLTFHGQKYL